jgi:hypothetical protein
LLQGMCEVLLCLLTCIPCITSSFLCHFELLSNLFAPMTHLVSLVASTSWDGLKANYYLDSLMKLNPSLTWNNLENLSLPRPLGTNSKNWCKKDFNLDNTKLFQGQPFSSSLKTLKGSLLIVPNALASYHFMLAWNNNQSSVENFKGIGPCTIILRTFSSLCLWVDASSNSSL